jgi:hypothetical protein
LISAIVCDLHQKEPYVTGEARLNNFVNYFYNRDDSFKMEESNDFIFNIGFIQIYFVFLDDQQCDGHDARSIASLKVCVLLSFLFFFKSVARFYIKKSFTEIYKI